MRTKYSSKTIGRFKFSIGFTLRTFCIGFGINRYMLDLDLGFVWLSVEF